MTNYKHETVVNADIESTFDWFEHEGSFRRLMPPWEVAEEVRADDSLEIGSQRVFKFPAPGMPLVNMTWVAEHTGYEKPNYFAVTLEKEETAHTLRELDISIQLLVVKRLGLLSKKIV
jgi:ligand-binding SRPBCC domain-containing protein